MSKKYRYVILLFVLLIVAVTACAEPGKQEGKSDSIARGYAKPLVRESDIHPAVDVDYQAIQKIDNMILYPDIVKKSLKVAAGQCMRNKGYIYSEKYFIPENSSVRLSISPAPLSVETARKHGYFANSENERKENISFSGGEESAYYGAEESSENGCMVDALGAVFGDREIGLYYVTIINVILPYANASLDAKEIEVLNEEWHQCMVTQKNMDYLSPPLAALDADGRREKSQDIAIADAGCPEQVRYEERLTNNLNAYMTSFLNDNQALLERVAQAKKNAEANAPKLLDGSAS